MRPKKSFFFVGFSNGKNILWVLETVDMEYGKKYAEVRCSLFVVCFL